MMNGINFLFAHPTTWLIAAAVLAAIWIAVKTIRTMSQQQEQSTKISVGLNSLLLLSGIVIMLGCLGYFGHMHDAACRDSVLPGSSFVTIITTVVESAEQMNTLADCYIQSSAAVLSGLLAALFIALLWLLLRHRVVNR
ncbi:hypothetical protein EH223_14375 [candidate division KSB1 bacterium]|nr:hypothetical protein [candidate division KSB1 bacterium]RQW01668.1 MAG: hypothetical protein EH223_14375 [candidate division KSB1 bacterium]